MERLSIQSFLACGHEYHLYTYGTVERIPPGVVVKAADVVLPKTAIFTYRDRQSYAGFSNHFRYKLLHQLGGWWVDCDVVCLQRFDFDSKVVFATERNSNGDQQLASCVLRVPAGDPTMKRAWEVCETKNRRNVLWGETGPQVEAQMIRETGRLGYIVPIEVFCPIDYSDWDRVLEPGRKWRFDRQTRAVHLWNEMWRRAGRDKTHSYDAGCLYEILKRRYGVTALDRPV